MTQRLPSEPAGPNTVGPWETLKRRSRLALTLILFAGEGLGEQTDPVLPVIDFENLAALDGCQTAPWFDTAPFNPTGGNDARTIGEARRNALTMAAEIMVSEFPSPIALRIVACWESEPDRSFASRGGPLGFLRGTPGLEFSDQYYSYAAAAHNAGADLCSFSDLSCDAPHLFVSFNIDVMDVSYLGFGQTAPVGNFFVSHFVSHAMHEIAHGMGLYAAIDENGQFIAGGPTAFDHLLVNREGVAMPAMTPSERAAALRSQAGLYFAGQEAAISPLNMFAATAPHHILMNAPFNYRLGVNGSDVAQSFCTLLNPLPCPGGDFLDLGVERAMLHAVGWHTGGNSPPYLGLMFDRARPGHGFQLVPAGTDASGTTVYVVTFYSYRGLGGGPEWFQAVGTFERGVFSGVRDGLGNGLVRFTYDASSSPPQQATNVPGQVVLTLNNPEQSAFCDDGVERGAPVVGFQFVTNRIVEHWCVEPLVSADLIAEPDLGGLWFSSVEDQGWGLTVENIQLADGSITLFVILYVYAQDGSPVWFFAQADGFRPGLPLTMDLVQRNGYPRSRQSGTLMDQVAGHITLTLSNPAESTNNTVTIDVDYLGREGGNWVRTDAPLQRLSTPR